MNALTLVQIPFHGDTIEAVQIKGGKILVRFKNVCGALGVDDASQIRKMRNREWCEVVDLTLPDERVRSQRLTMIDHESLPMWLATINAISVKQEAKPKLVRYQQEAKARPAGVVPREVVSRPATRDRVRQDQVAVL
jgi:prophage antirepressor-like protein